MNIAQLMGLLRVALGMFGGATALAPLLHTTPDAINGVVNAPSAGAAVVGGAAILGSAAWTYMAHTVSATVDRAVSQTGGAASPLAPVAGSAKQGQTGLKGRVVGG